MEAAFACYTEANGKIRFIRDGKKSNDKGYLLRLLNFKHRGKELECMAAAMNPVLNCKIPERKPQL